MSIVLQQNEVILAGQRYKILGTVRDQIVNPFPAKIKFGDYTRDDDTIKSSWVMSDWTGGLGIVHGDPRRFPDRYNYGMAETRFPRALALLPRVDAYEGLGTAQHIETWLGRTLFFVGPGIYTRSEIDGDYQQIGQVSSTPSDSAHYAGYLWIAQGSSYPVLRFDGTEFVECEPLNEEDEIFGASLLVAMEDKLFALGGDNRIYWTIDGEVWEPGGQLGVGTGWISQLLVYFDQSGMPAIHGVGRDGVYAYDFDTGIWIITPLMYPIHPYIGKACVWQSDLYVPVGMSIYRYNGQVIQSVGPDKDEGLPEQYHGYISRLIPTHPYLYAAVNSIAEIEGELLGEQIYPGSPWRSAILPGSSSRGLILCSTGIAWHPVWESESGVEGAVLSDGEQRYRLWWSSAEKLFNIDVPKSLHNSLRNPTTEFEESGYVITSWMDAQWPEIDKLTTDIKVTASRLSETERYEIRVQWDREDGPWEFLGRSDGSERQVFQIDRDDGGRLFRKMRMRIDLYRGDDPTKTPVIDNVTLSFMLMPEPIWSYQFTIDLSGKHASRSVRELKRELLSQFARRKAFDFAFTDADFGQPVVKRVVFSRNAGVNITGYDRRGRVNISLIEMEPAL